MLARPETLTCSHSFQMRRSPQPEFRAMLVSEETSQVEIPLVESNLLTPLVMREAVSLHPVVVLVSVTLAGAAFGVLGAFLAVPVAVATGVLVEELWFQRLEAKKSKG